MMSDNTPPDGSSSRRSLPIHPLPGAARAASPAEGGLLDIIGDDVLAAIAADYLDLLGTETSIHDVLGKRALGLFPSGWCAYMDGASRANGDGVRAGDDGAQPRTECQRWCWEASRAAIESGTEFQGQCGSGIEIFAVPIRAGTRVVGAINAAVGEPPRGESELARLAAAYGVDASTLREHAARYPPRTPEAVEAAKTRLRRAAELIGEMVARRAAERERERLFQAEARARARLQRLQEATAALAAALTPRAVATVTIDAGMRAAGAMGGVVVLSREGRELNVLASSGCEEVWAGIWSAGREPPAPILDVLSLAQPVMLGNREEMLRCCPRLAEWGPAAGLSAVATFPLLAGAGAKRRAFGVVCFGFDAERDFAQDEIAYLEALANLGAQAMDRALAYAAERAARLEAERANAAKASFLAVTSHELRTPLNAIAGYTELLEMGVHGPTTPAQLEALGRIRYNQQHLLGQINNILEFARLEAGRVTYHLEDLAVAEVVAGVGVLVEPILAGRELLYQIELPEDLPPVHADRDRLTQVLVNLLTNAAKFTESGGRVRLQAGAVGDAVQLRVSDTGAGIPADRLESIFEPFIRVEGTQPRQEGAGLGLAIVRELTRGMGGDVVAESTPGKGSIFTISLRTAGKPAA